MRPHSYFDVVSWTHAEVFPWNRKLNSRIKMPLNGFLPPGKKKENSTRKIEVIIQNCSTIEVFVASGDKLPGNI
jgi:hypothetical protein